MKKYFFLFVLIFWNNLAGFTIGNNNVLVVFFSRTGTTERIANLITNSLDADIYQIEAEEPYLEEDIDYTNSKSRTSREHNDKYSRPRIANLPKDINKYDTVFLGYPIWHGQAPRIISTFLENYNFNGKTIIPFCTSHSSGIGSSARNLHSIASSASWKTGKRFSKNSDSKVIIKWVESFNLKPSKLSKVGIFDFTSKKVLLNSGYMMPITGLGTYSLSDDECANSIASLFENGGRLIDTAFIYRNEAAVGLAVRKSAIPREDIFVTTKLYPNQFRNAEEAIDEALDKMELEYIDLMLLHHPGEGDVKAYKAMEKAVADGKIHSIGLSNWYIEEIEEFLPQINIIPAVVQNEIHPFYQENDVIPYMKNLGIVVEGWYPLGGRGYTGSLLGNEIISGIAEDHNVSSAQVILRWNLQKSVVVIPGSSNPEHIKENLELFHFELTSDEMNRINALDRGEKHDWY